MTIKRQTGPLAQYQSRSNQQLAQLLDQSAVKSPTLLEAMRYSVLPGGKRLRPVLVYVCGQCFGASLESLDVPACAVELIHCYSLIHDDLPAMDDDALRRGRPTCHIVFNEAIAILAGDALQSLAFEILADQSTSSTHPNLRLQMIAELAQAIGYNGMAGGQVLDLYSTAHNVSLHNLETIHHLKTSTLFTSSVILGALASNCQDKTILRNLRCFAQNLGLAFQIQDDLFDAHLASSVLGKPQGSDKASNKPTYADYYDVPQGQKLINELIGQAQQALDTLGHQGAPLRAFADYLMARRS